jgi:hypothetical protein
MVHIFKNFQKMVENAILVEHARKEMGEQKRKFESSGSSAATPAPISRPHKEHLSVQEDRMSTTGRISNSASTNRVSSSSKLSVPVSQCSVLTFHRIARVPLLGHL